MGNKRDRENTTQVEAAIRNKNFSQTIDRRVYELIESCAETIRIPWRHISPQKQEIKAKVYGTIKS